MSYEVRMEVEHGIEGIEGIEDIEMLLPGV
jgi:hypothetical protein